MKKDLIYTVIFLLCGSIFFSSCQDMLEGNSDRVDDPDRPFSATDSVYSVLGILKSVQGVADRQVLLNELRGDLVSVNKSKAVADVQDIYNFRYSNGDNKYLDVKDYYTIINNCNIYLSRVDTTIIKNGVNVMMPEYVAVKSFRAWTYLQLVINYNSVPYFTEPITTHGAAQDVMDAPKLSRDEVLDRLIADILPYENPSQYPMPKWYDNGKVLSFGYNNTKVETKQLFVPIRMLLGDMYLWKKDYAKAARCFYNQITGYGTNNTARKYTDNGNVVKYTSEGGKGLSNGYSSLFAAESYSNNESKIFTVIPFAAGDNLGTISELASVFCPTNEVGGAQVSASPGFVSLSRSQKYRYIKGETDDPTFEEYGDGYEYPGDLRIKATTYSQIATGGIIDVEYGNIIRKFNLETAEGYGMDYKENHVPKLNTTYLMLQRAELAYLRLAEAVAGLRRAGYNHGYIVKNETPDVKKEIDLSMTILKEGPKYNYRLYKDAVLKDRIVMVPQLNADGDTIKDENGKIKFIPDSIALKDKNGEFIKDENGKIIREPKKEKYLASSTDSVDFDFSNSAFDVNIGIHSRGTGDAEHNEFYALDTLCVARYLGATEIEEKDGKETEKPIRQLDEDDFNRYIVDLIIDELALELSWEGTRFGDLIRFSEAMDDPDILAMRVAGRESANSVKYRDEKNGYQFDNTLYSKLLNKENWYLPLPDEVVEPVEK